MIYTAKNCRSCGDRLDALVDLGELSLSGFLAPGEHDRERAPLILCACRSCKLVQLRHTVARDALFRRYWYRSGVNETMQRELRDVVDAACTMVGPFETGDAVLDIGANDGTLLERYRARTSSPPSRGVLRVAYEPAANLQDALHTHADVVVPDYFPEEYRAVKGLEGRCKIITSIAMVYTVDDLVPFLTAIAALLHDDGVWIVQFQDLAGMLRSCAFDNVCHEHLTYPSLQSFSELVAPYGLHVIDAETRAINGGSYRLAIAHRGHAPSARVAQLRAAEAGCQDWQTLEAFDAQVRATVRQIRAALSAWKSAGLDVDLYGASTKANTLLQVCGLDARWLRQAWERSPEKVGRRTSGSHVPIVSEADGRADPPAALLVGIWQFRDAVVAREQAFLDQGGALIFPLPRVDQVCLGGEVGQEPRHAAR
jgi:NDP-4-keto-2,6-dideoxyhexose 3-C-methyltransferase